jgi:hypothetical protein
MGFGGSPFRRPGAATRGAVAPCPPGGSAAKAPLTRDESQEISLVKSSMKRIATAIAHARSPAHTLPLIGLHAPLFLRNIKKQMLAKTLC